MGFRVVCEIGESSGAKPKKVYLDDLQPSDSYVGFWKLGTHGEIAVNGLWKEMKESVPAHSLCTHPPRDGAAHVSYQLDGRFADFKATAVVANRTVTPLTFAVFGDGKLLWQSRALKSLDDSEECAISIREVKTLKLQVDCPGSNGGAVPVWIDPVVER
jgi:hypothetical protein